MSRTRVFEWHKRFSEGREEVEDDERTGRPVTSRIEENIKKVNEIVRKDRRLSLRMISDLSNIDRETVRKILHEDLKMTKVCAKMVPKNLTLEQKENRKNICIDIMQQLEADPGLLEKVVTCDETWIFQYDPETKRQSMHWKTQSSPRMKKARMSKSKLKAMLIIFFDSRGVIMVEWVPQGQTVNQKYYIEVLEKLRERNAPAHNALSVKQFLAKKSIPVLEHPPYSPDLAPCDFYLFPKIKSSLKGTRFESVEDVKEKTADLLKRLTLHDMQHCFEQWKTRMQRCIDREGEYVEGD
nr:unnamed protein product [Callosobruchus chinensis]